MAQLNEMILSEITFKEGLSEKMKEFLKWILEFERENIDKEHVLYKPEIEKKLNELLSESITKK